MIITCKECNSSFKVDDSLIKETGSKVKCSKCENIFIAYPHSPEDDLFSDTDEQLLGLDGTSEFNDPSKPAYSRKNRRDKQLGTSHDIELVELLDRAVSENPVGKKQLVQSGIIKALDDLGYRKDLIKLGYDIA